MKLYFAGAESDMNNLSDLGVERILIALSAKPTKIIEATEIWKNKNKPLDLLIDSGAFTFKSKGVDMPVEKWLQEYEKVKTLSNKIIALDVIGNGQKTYDNFCELQNVSKDFIPCYHLGTDISYLKKYADQCEYIAIGGMVPLKHNFKKLNYELNKIFNSFSKENCPKFHAFGYFNHRVLANFPFYSADATTWQNYSRFGEVHILENMKYNRIKSIKTSKNVNYFSFSLKDAPKKRFEICVKTVLNYEKYITDLWKIKGINWEE